MKTILSTWLLEYEKSNIETRLDTWWTPIRDCHTMKYIPKFTGIVVPIHQFYWELREFSNFAKTRVRMLSFHMFHFTMLFTSGRMCCDNILMRVHTKLIWLSLTLNTSLENCTGVQTVFDRERVLSTISYSNCYRLYCTKRDVVSYRGQLHAMINYIGLFL